jgi:heavy metal sensor kinase
MERTPAPRLNISISARLTLWYGLTIMLLLSLFAVVSYTTFHITLHRDYDEHLTHEQRELMQFLRYEQDPPHFEFLDNLHSVAYQTEGVYGTFVRLLSVEGEELFQSPNFANLEQLPVDLPAGNNEVTVSRKWDGKPSRTRFVPLTNADRVQNGWLEITGFEWSLHQQLVRLGRSLFLGVILSTLIAIGGGFLLARRALSPVATLTAGAKSIRAGDLATRLPTNFGVRDELTDLAETFNGMIERLESSFNRERRFSSNAAHELLTPLTTLRNTIDVTLSRERDVARYQKTLREALVDVDHMSETVRGLLRLAHAERLSTSARQSINLSKLILERVRRFGAESGTGSTQIRSVVDPNIYVAGDTALVRDVLDNLIENAIKYSLENGEITVALSANDTDATIRVSDNGMGFTPEQSAHLFDRFYRGDTAQMRGKPGSGLGLTVVKAIVESLGGSATAHSDGVGRGSTFTVTLPRGRTGGIHRFTVQRRRPR